PKSASRKVGLNSMDVGAGATVFTGMNSIHAFIAFYQQYIFVDAGLVRLRPHPGLIGRYFLTHPTADDRAVTSVVDGFGLPDTFVPAALQPCPQCAEALGLGK